LNGSSYVLTDCAAFARRKNQRDQGESLLPSEHNRILCPEPTIASTPAGSEREGVAKLGKKHVAQSMNLLLAAR
jgi:hypothetical protein